MHLRIATRRNATPARLVIGAGLLATLLVASGCRSGVSQTKHIRLAGAQIPLELVDSWLEKSYEPAFYVERVQPVYLSQNGFDALARGDCDFAVVDRTPGEAEAEKFAGMKISGRRVAFYGFALYVNTQNKIDSIFSKHIEMLFKKRVVNWKDLGGEDAPVALYGPRKDTRGGTILAREAGIWFSEPTWTPLDSDQQVIDRVRAEPNALGFAAVGHDGDGVRYVGLRTERRGTGVLPSLEAIEDDRYGLAKVIYVYWREPLSETGRAAVDYLFSDAGQRAMLRTDVFPIPRERAIPPATGAAASQPASQPASQQRP